MDILATIILRMSYVIDAKINYPFLIIAYNVANVPAIAVDIIMLGL